MTPNQPVERQLFDNWLIPISLSEGLSCGDSAYPAKSDLVYNSAPAEFADGSVDFRQGRSDGYGPREGMHNGLVVDDRVRLLWNPGDSISELDTTSA